MRRFTAEATAPGMATRQYARQHKSYSHGRAGNGKSWLDRKPGGKNPIRNGVRLLFRHCGSDSHFIPNCDKLNREQKFHLAEHSQILFTKSVTTESEDADRALDIIQDFDDDKWNEFITTCPGSRIDAEEPNSTHLVDISGSNTDSNEDTTEYSAPLFSALADIYYSHGVLESASSTEHHQILFTQRASSPQFEGICVDNGAQKSVAGLPAYKLHCSFANYHPKYFQRQRRDFLSLGDTLHNSIGKSCIRMPIAADNNFIEYITDVVNVDFVARYLAGCSIPLV